MFVVKQWNSTEWYKMWRPRIARKSADKGRKLTAERWRRGVSEQKETRKEVDG